MLQLVSILFVGAGVAASLFRPTVALAFLTLMFPLEQLLQANVTFFVTQASAFNILSGLVAVVSIVVLWLRRPGITVGSLNPTALCAFGLFLYAALSLIWTWNPEWGIETVRNAVPYAIVLLVLAPLLANDLGDLLGYCKVTLLMSLFIALQVLANPNLELYGARLALSLHADEKTNPLVYGTMGGMMMIFAALLHSDRSRLWLIVRFSSAFLGLGLGLLSGSRGQVIFAFVVAIVFFPISQKVADLRRLLGIAGVAVTLGFAAFLGARFFISYENELRWGSESLAYGGLGRLENAVDLLSAWIQEPAYLLIGLGYFAFGEIQSRSGDGYSHVMLADALGELGLIGFTLYVSFWILTTGVTIRLFNRYREHPEARSLIATIAALLAFGFLLQNKQGTLYGIDACWPLALMLARIEARERVFGADPVLSSQEIPEFEDEPVDEPYPARITT